MHQNHIFRALLNFDSPTPSSCLLTKQTAFCIGPCKRFEWCAGECAVFSSFGESPTIGVFFGILPTLFGSWTATLTCFGLLQCLCIACCALFVGKQPRVEMRNEMAHTTTESSKNSIHLFESVVQIHLNWPFGRPCSRHCVEPKQHRKEDFMSHLQFNILEFHSMAS